MPLTDTAIKNAKPASKAACMFDGGGLYLEVAPAGGKWWRFKYRFNGKEKRLSLGVYPDVGLKDARQRRDDARKLLANGVDPGENRKAVKAAKNEQAANSFEVVGREWFSKKSPGWAVSNASKIIQRLENDAFPWLGNRPIAEVTPPELLKVLRRIEDRGAIESAHRMRSYCGQIFRYAIATGRAERDPSADLRGALPTHVKQHRAAITDPKATAELLRAIDGYQGTFVTKCALRLAPLLFVRPGELRKAEWAEIDLDRAEWNIPADRMKMQHTMLKTGKLSINPARTRTIDRLIGFEIFPVKLPQFLGKLFPQEETPVVCINSKREGMSIISSVHNKGTMRWKIFEGTLNVGILIDFLRRLVKGADKNVLLILDNLRVHHGMPVKA